MINSCLAMMPDGGIHYPASLWMFAILGYIYIYIYHIIEWVRVIILLDKILKWFNQYKIMANGIYMSWKTNYVDIISDIIIWWEVKL